jgi:hypothetical protein
MRCVSAAGLVHLRLQGGEPGPRRIVDRLRAAPDGAWTEVDAPIGSHDAVAVGVALDALARDGLVELDGEDRRLARLATA